MYKSEIIKICIHIFFPLFFGEIIEFNLLYYELLLHQSEFQSSYVLTKTIISLIHFLGLHSDNI